LPNKLLFLNQSHFFAERLGIMRLKFALLLIVVFICNVNILGDDGDRVGTQVLLFQQGFILESLSGYGFSNGAMQSITTLGSGNPATLSNFNKLSTGLSYQFDTGIDSFLFISDVAHKRSNNALPQSAGVIIPIDILCVGASYNQKYTSQYEFRNEIRTINNPEGTGEFWTAEFNRNVSYFSLLTSYQLKEAFSPSDNITFGFQFNLNFLNIDESLFSTSAKLSSNSPNWKFGILYDRGKSFDNKFQLGVYYETAVSISGDVELEGFQFVGPDTNMIPGINEIPVPVTFNVTAKLPLRMVLGYYINVSPLFGFAGDFIYTWWSSRGNSYKNNLDFNSSFLFNIQPSFLLSFGFYFSQGNIEGSASSNAVFLSGGVIYKIKGAQFQLALAASHLFSERNRQQTIFKFGLGFSL